MVNVLARNWGFVALRGVAALLFGLITLLLPALSLAVLVLLFGAYSLVDGALEIGWAVSNRRNEPHWVSLLITGLLGVAVGVVTLLWPGVTAIALLYIIAFWAVVVGIGEIIAAVRLRKVIRNEWLLGLAGLISVTFGVLVALAPGLGALAMLFWIGIYAVLGGIVLLALAFRLRRWKKAAAEG